MPRLNNLTRLSSTDIPPAAGTLARAFVNDPMIAYIFPKDPLVEHKLQLLFPVMLRYGLLYGEVYATSKNMEGVAIWLDSDNSDMSLEKLELCGLSDFSSQVSQEAIEKLVYLNDFAHARNMQLAPFKHMYLAFIGVDPDLHGKGFASELLKPMLARMDSQSLPCYLETATEKNVEIYRHFGFEMKEKASVPGTGVYFYIMLREAEGGR